MGHYPSGVLVYPQPMNAMTLRIPPQKPTVENTITIRQIWAGHTVAFCLRTETVCSGICLLTPSSRYILLVTISSTFEVILTVHRRYYVEIKCQLDTTDDIYCRFYCMLNMFRAILCPSSGAREYYTDGRCLWYLVLWFSGCRYGVELEVMCPVCRLLL